MISVSRGIGGDMRIIQRVGCGAVWCGAHPQACSFCLVPRSSWWFSMIHRTPPCLSSLSLVLLQNFIGASLHHWVAELVWNEEFQGHSFNNLGWGLIRTRLWSKGFSHKLTLALNKLYHSLILRIIDAIRFFVKKFWLEKYLEKEYLAKKKFGPSFGSSKDIWGKKAKVHC